MSSEEKKQALNQKYLEFQLLQQHVKEAQVQLQVLKQQNTELLKSKESLKDIANADIKKEVLSQIGPGIFIKTELLDNKTVLVNVGSNVLISASMQEAGEMISKQSSELEETINKIEEQLGEASLHLNNLQQELQDMSSDAS